MPVTPETAPLRGKGFRLQGRMYVTIRGGRRLAGLSRPLKQGAMQTEAIIS